MAIFNSTRSSSFSLLLSMLKGSFFRLRDEKKSCSLRKLSDIELLFLNGKSIEISYSTPFHSFPVKEVGRVLAVLIPHRKRDCSSSILFLREGHSEPNFYEDIFVSDILFR